MKVAKALKLKNKMLSEYTDLVNKMICSNSSISTAKKNYNAKELFDKSRVSQSEIVKLKTAIHEASAPIRSKIFEIGELKSFVSYFNRINTQEGLVKERGYGAGVSEDIYVVDFSELEKVEIVKSLQDQIEAIQEELDSFNATTEVAY